MSSNTQTNPAASGVDIQSLNEAVHNIQIHLNNTTTYYTLTDSELIELENLGNSIIKDILFCSIGVFISTIISGTVAILKPDAILSTEILINYLFSSGSFTIGVLTAIIWIKEKKRRDDIIKKIKEKPAYKLQK